MKQLTSILCSILLLNACASHTDIQFDCSGLTKTQALRYNKNTHRFMQHDSKMVRAYGLDVTSRPETLFLRACTSLPTQTNSQIFKQVSVTSPGYYGIHGFLHCTHRSDEPSYQIYQIFIDWAKQPLPLREETLAQTNEKIRSLNCPNSGAKHNEPAWYVENEQHGQTPVLVSNARDHILLNGIFANRTIAIDLETAQYISRHIQQYFEGTK